jgi:RNA polymerase sigma-70 factor (ECF subfamily)
LIRGAAAGSEADRAGFAARYVPVVRAYLEARWRTSPHLQNLDDAIQEVFLACFRPGGVLARADSERAGGFRAYLHGVIRNVARRVEAGQLAGRRGEPAAAEVDLDLVPADDPSLSRAFDRAWAEALIREAAGLQANRARERGHDAERRVELLRLRFYDGLPIREIARLWEADPAKLHHEYATARHEFLAALREVVAFHQPGPPDAVERACGELIGLLS